MYIIILFLHVFYSSEGCEQSMNRVLYVQWWRLWTVLYNSEVMNIAVQHWGHKQYVETRELWPYAYTEAEFMNVQFHWGF